MKYRRQIAVLCAAAAFALSAAACGSSDEALQSGNQGSAAGNETDSGEGSGQAAGNIGIEDGNILIAYFTAADNSGVDAETSASYSMIDGEAKGRLQAIAEMIQENAGGDLFSIQTDVVYPADGGELIEYAAEEQEEDKRPALTSQVENFDSYNTVFVGYPIWWGIAAWPVDTFVKANDFTGKTVIPFATSSSSGLGESGRLLAEMAGTGEWLDGERFSSGASEAEVQEWAEGLGL